MIQPWHIWVLIALFFVILEIFTSGFAVACFSVGALAAAVGAALGLTLWWQILLFAVFSALAFAFVRPLIMKMFFHGKKETLTNADALTGRTGVISQTVDAAAGTGRVKIDGDDWKARSEDGSVLPEGTRVTVCSRDGLTLIVK